MSRIGKTVHYKPTQEDKNYMKNANTICNSSDLLPAIIVADWSESCVNLKVLLDGVGDLWKTSMQKGTEEGNWNDIPQE